MKVITVNNYKNRNKNYRKLARKTSKIIRMYKKNNKNNGNKIIEVIRYIYINYSMIDITYSYENSDITVTTNIFCSV